jgi:hypothetical protein
MPAASHLFADPAHALDQVRDALRTLRYGTITLTVHNGTVVQIDRTERQRLDRQLASSTDEAH